MTLVVSVCDVVPDRLAVDVADCDGVAVAVHEPVGVSLALPDWVPVREGV